MQCDIFFVVFSVIVYRDELWGRPDGKPIIWNSLELKGSFQFLKRLVALKSSETHEREWISISITCIWFSIVSSSQDYFYHCSKLETHLFVQWWNGAQELLCFFFCWRLCKWSLKCVWVWTFRGVCVCVYSIAKPDFQRQSSRIQRAVPLPFEP